MVAPKNNGGATNSDAPDEVGDKGAMPLLERQGYVRHNHKQPRYAAAAITFLR